MNEQPQSSTESLSLFSHLPDELIPQILLRLPVRSLLRFKCVCKSWLSLISDPQFGKSHFDVAASPTHRCLTKANDTEIESIDVDATLHDDESSVVNLKFPPPPPREKDRDNPSDVEFVGSCRGFVLAAYPEGDVIVWNPSTGFQRRIVDDLTELISFGLCGFGYDKSTDDYLLVLMDVIRLHWFSTFPFDADEVASRLTCMHIFSMKTNSWLWDYQKGAYPQYVDMEHSDFNIGCFLNNALHWLVSSYETNLHVIIAFDLVQRSLSEIALSQTLDAKIKSKPIEYHLRVMGECLSLCYPGDASSRAEIWIMKDYKVQSSWTMLFVFSTCNIPHNEIFPICFTKQGEIFCSYGSGGLVILNDKGWLLLDQSTKWSKPHQRFGTYRESTLHCGFYRESLLSLPNDVEEASEDDQLAISSEGTGEDNQ